MYTIDLKIFPGNNFCLLNFCCYEQSTKNSIGQNYTCCTKITVQLALSLIICGRKYFTRLIIVVEEDCRKCL